jgi:hypothetical protein
MIGTDANLIIRLLEGTPVVRAPLEARLQPLRGTTLVVARSATPLWNGLLTVPLTGPKISPFSNEEETFGHSEWHGQETVPQR